MPIFDTERKALGIVGTTLHNVGQDIFGRKKKRQMELKDPPPAGPILPQQQQAPTPPPNAINDFLTTDAGPVGQAQVSMHGFPRGTEEPPAPGFARAWHRNATGTTSPVQTFQGKIGAPNVTPPVSGGRDFSGGAGGMGTESAQQIGSFYDKLGIPLGGVMQGAQQDEAMGRQAFARREQGEGVTRGLQQAGMAHQLSRAPQTEAMQVLQTLGDPGMFQFTQTPEGKALIQHYMSQLMPQGAAQTPAPTAAPAAPTPAPQVPGGGWRAALRTGVPAAAGTAGWGLGAAMAPETGGLSFLVPAAASAASAFGGNKLMDWLDPQGMQAVEQHPVAALGGGALGAYGGYKGVGRMGAKTQAPVAEPEAPPVINRPVQTSAGVGAGEGSAPWETMGGEPTIATENPQVLSELDKFRNQLGIQPGTPQPAAAPSSQPLQSMAPNDVLAWLRQPNRPFSPLDVTPPAAPNVAAPLSAQTPEIPPAALDRLRKTLQSKRKKPPLATGEPPF